MRPLNDEERRLVETNVGLVYHVATSLAREGKLVYCTLDEAVSEGMLGLVKAAVLFDPLRGTRFSTLAVNSIRMHIINMQQRERTQVKYRSVSLDEDAKQGGGSGEANDAEWKDAIPAADDVEVEAVDWLREAVNNLLNERAARMLLENTSGRTINDIAEEYGITKQRVSKQICDAKKILQKALNREDWR